MRLQQELRGLLAAKGVPSLVALESGTNRSARELALTTSLTNPSEAGAEIAGAAYRGGVK